MYLIEILILVKVISMEEFTLICNVVYLIEKI